jgi:hypothetical protein
MIFRGKRQKYSLSGVLMKPKFKLINVSLASITSFLTCTPVLAGSGPLTPLYETYYGGYTDTFLTTSAQERAVAVNQYGYQDLGIVGYLLSNAATGTVNGPSGLDAPFARFFKGAPQIEHFYTISPSEQSAVLGFGYVAERQEGYLFTSGAASFTTPRGDKVAPLIRLSKFNSSNGDLVHKWTTNAATVNSLISQGWGNDGTAGYVWPPSSKTEGLERFVQLGTSDTFGIATNAFCDALIVNGVGSCDIIGGFGYRCPEKVEIYINDVYTGTFDSDYGVQGFNTYGCSAGRIQRPTLNFPKLTVRVERSGFVGTYAYRVSGATTNIFRSAPPGSGTLFLSPSSF